MQDRQWEPGKNLSGGRVCAVGGRRARDRAWPAGSFAVHAGREELAASPPVAAYLGTAVRREALLDESMGDDAAAVEMDGIAGGVVAVIVVAAERRAAAPDGLAAGCRSLVAPSGGARAVGG